MARQTRAAEASAPKRRRADAERSIAAILDAALEALASDPDSSMSEIARRAGVVRATIYVHFPTRDALLDAVMDHAISQVVEVLATAEPERGEPAEALARLLAAAWRQLDSFHSLVRINTTRLSKEDLHRRHMPVLEQLAPLIERGQQAGVFRADLPIAWHLSMTLAIIHAASGEVEGRRIDETVAEVAMIDTVLAAIGETS